MLTPSLFVFKTLVDTAQVIVKLYKEPMTIRGDALRQIKCLCTFPLVVVLFVAIVVLVVARFYTNGSCRRWR